MLARHANGRSHAYPLVPRATTLKRLLELDLLRTLVVVSENGSFTRAADLLHRTQAAISMQIRRLEHLAGVSLIARDKREFRLTDEGEALVLHAKRMLALNDEAVASLSPDVLEGTVRIAAPDMLAIHVLPSLLAEFSRRHPQIQIQLQSGVSQHEIADTLQGVHFDLMIALEPFFPLPPFDVTLLRAHPGGGRAAKALHDFLAERLARAMTGR